MISYNIEPHDITTLTAPMFDACGIECPAMIGANCLGRDNSRYMDGPADAAHYRRSCPGHSSKFPSAAAEVVYGWDADERAGGGESGHPWFGLHRTPEDERHDDTPMGAGVILTELSTGGVELTVFDSAEELAEVWAKIVREVEPGLCRHCSDELTLDGSQLISVETGSAHCGANPSTPDHEPEETD